MWTFFKKNLWMWRPNRDGMVYVLIGALAVSCLDAFFHIPTPLWVGVCALAVILSQAAANGAMNDFKDDCYHFLEYLPIRWSRVWLANWTVNLAGCLLLVPLLCWRRVLTWTPAASIDSEPMFTTRWSLPIGLCCFIYFSFNYALIGRSLFKSAKASMLVMLWGQIFLFAGGFAMLLVARVFPGARDLWPLLMVQGTIFAGCSFAILVMPPRYWSAGRRFLFVGLPAMVLTTILFFTALQVECRRWEQLDWTEPGLTIRTSIVPGEHPMVIADVTSPRSMSHHFACDPQEGTIRFIGRNLMQLNSSPAWQGEESACFKAFPPMLESWPTPDPVVMVKADDRPPRTILASATTTDGAGGKFIVEGAVETRGGRYLVGISESGVQHNAIACLLGSDGQIVKRFANASEFLIGKSGLYLSVTSSVPPVNGEDREYLLYDPTNGRERRFKLPGSTICFSQDLGLCACLVESPHGDVKDRSVVLVNIPDGAQRVIIPVGVLPPVPKSSAATVLPLVIQRQFGGDFQIDDTHIIFDNTFSQAVLWLPRYEGSSLHYSLLHVNLKNGSRRTLRGESEMPVLGMSRSMYLRNALSACGFDSAADACVYQVGTTFTRVSIPATDATAPVCSEIRYASDSTQAELSPSGAEVLLTTWKPTPDGRSTRQVELVGFDRPNAPVTLSTDGTYQFLDQQHLVCTTKDRVTITDLQGRTQRQLLPPVDR